MARTAVRPAYAFTRCWNCQHEVKHEAAKHKVACPYCGNILLVVRGPVATVRLVEAGHGG